ncbi:MAG: DUF402 domain-containing protein [Halodesulfurarchaeum sp.]
MPSGTDPAVAVRIRGIYTTALTRHLLDDGADVVQASTPIQDRFDVEFDEVTADVAVEMTDDRQGSAITGEAPAVAKIAASIEDLGRDTFTWPAGAPRGAIFRGTVTDTVGGGGIVELGTDREGYLPFGAVADHLETGDAVRVQVHEPAAPWADARPQLDTEIRAVGGIVSLVRGVESLVAGTPDGTPTHELARTTELLSVDVPDGWGVDWAYGADEVDMTTLEGALSRAVERAEDIDAALSEERDSDAGGLVVAPVQSTWAWFGRETRFALDEIRREVTPTIAGHHRIKAGSDGAAVAVDFAERLGRGDGEMRKQRGEEKEQKQKQKQKQKQEKEKASAEFPFEAVTDVFGPTEGDAVTISHGKPAGHCLTLGRGTVTDRSIDRRRITVTREIKSAGTYDALGVDREPGDEAISRFAEGRWWYPTVYRSEAGEVKGTYVNVSTPVELFPDTVRYVDLHVDVIKGADGTVEIVDRDELTDAVDAGLVPESAADQALDVAEKVAGAFEDDS